MLEQLKTDVSTIATPAGRVVGSDAHRNARRFIERRCGMLGLSGYDDGRMELPYSVNGTEFCNIVGVLPGSDAGTDPILIAAHYDTCGVQPGADDNAAAVSILLSMIEPLRAAKLTRSVIFAFPDAEEPPNFLGEAMGSTRWYHDQRQNDVHCAIVLDLVGHDVPVPGLADVIFMTGMESDPGFEPVFRSVEPEGIRIVPALTRYIGDLSDYHAFRIDRRPYLFFSCGRWEHYHATTDTPDRLNYEKMAALSKHLTALVVRLDSTLLSGPFEGYDTTATEIEYMSRHMRPTLESLGIELTSREDVDALVGRLLGLFSL